MRNFSKESGLSGGSMPRLAAASYTLNEEGWSDSSQSDIERETRLFPQLLNELHVAHTTEIEMLLQRVRHLETCLEGKNEPAIGPTLGSMRMPASPVSPNFESEKVKKRRRSGGTSSATRPSHRRSLASGLEMGMAVRTVSSKTEVSCASSSMSSAFSTVNGKVPPIKECPPLPAPPEPQKQLGDVATQAIKEQVEASGESVVVSQAPENKVVSEASGSVLTSKRGTLANLKKARLPKWMQFLEPLVSVIIITNVIEQVLRLEYQGYIQGVSMGLQESGEWPDLEAVFSVTPHIFCLAFLFELGIRLYFLRTKYFYQLASIQWFNMLDFVVTVSTVIDLYIVQLLMEQTTTNVALLRGLRFFRLIRALRVARTLELFDPLRVLLVTVAGSFICFFWSLVLLMITMIAGALIQCQLVSFYLTDPAISETTRAWSYEMYGTMSRAFWTIFEATFSGGWPNYARLLVTEVSIWFAFFWFVYVTGIIFAMTRIISALFLKDTLAFAANDAEFAIKEKMKEKKNYAVKLLEFFQAADTSANGTVSLEEFEAFLLDDQVKAFLTSLELDASEARNLFALLDDGDGEITPEEFVGGAVRLKGMARSQDVITIMHDCTRLLRAQDMFYRMLGQIWDVVHVDAPAVVRAEHEGMCKILSREGFSRPHATHAALRGDEPTQV